MANTTPYYSLTQPEPTELYNIGIFNSNAGIIDDALHTISDKNISDKAELDNTITALTTRVTTNETNIATNTKSITTLSNNLTAQIDILKESVRQNKTETDNALYNTTYPAINLSDSIDYQKAIELIFNVTTAGTTISIKTILGTITPTNTVLCVDYGDDGDIIIGELSKMTSHEYSTIGKYAIRVFSKTPFILSNFAFNSTGFVTGTSLYVVRMFDPIAGLSNDTTTFMINKTTLKEVSIYSNKIKSIPQYFLDGNNSNTFTKLVLPDSIEIIKDHGLYRCRYTDDTTHLPKNLKAIETYGCYYLGASEGVYVSKSLERVENYGLRYAYVYYEGTSEEWAAVTKNGSYATSTVRYEYPFEKPSIFYTDYATINVIKNAYNTSIWLEKMFTKISQIYDLKYDSEIQISITNNTYIPAIQSIPASGVIDWGDKNIDKFTSNTELQHTYTDSTTPHTITIKADLTELQAYAFNGNTNITKCVLGTEITNLYDYCFANVGTLTIYYKGTEDEWNNIIKATTWNENSTITVEYNYVESE